MLTCQLYNSTVNDNFLCEILRFQWYSSSLKKIHQEFDAKRNSNSSLVQTIFPWVHILYRNMLKWIHDEYFISEIFTDSMATKNLREYLIQNDGWVLKFLEISVKSCFVRRFKPQVSPRIISLRSQDFMWIWTTDTNLLLGTKYKEHFAVAMMI